MGFEEQLDASLQLLRHFMDHAKADKKSFNELLTGVGLAKSTFFEGGTSNIMTALRSRVFYGEESSYLTQLNKKELKALGTKGLMERFRELQEYDYTVLYSGRKGIEQVAAALRLQLDTDKPSKAAEWTHIATRQYDKPTVFFYDLPGSRQVQLTTYQTFAPQQTGAQKATLKLLGEYFGGGMFSLMFQEVREFRAMAYSASGYVSTPAPAYPDDPAFLVSSLGTQADKALQAIQLVDSLLHTMPLKENNLVSAKFSLQAEANNGYPNFRNLPGTIYRLRRLGYAEDPDKAVMEALPAVDAAAVQALHQSVIAPAPVMYIIVGDRKTLPMEEIAKYGEIVEYKQADIYK